MIIDSSAALAILQQEPEAASFADIIARAPERSISAVSVLETGMVILSRRGTAGQHDLDDFIAASQLDIIPFDAQQASIAREAFARFGKGRHRASLNFGDCASYALAMSRAVPLLFKGTDFSHTDVTPALP